MLRKRTIAVGLAVLALVAWVAWPVAEAQFGGGGIGGGGAQGDATVSGHAIMIVPSQSGKSLNAYSETTGEWDKLSAEPHPEHGLTPIVSSMLAAVGGKTHVHAFSTDFGRWATVDVGVPVEINKIAVNRSRVAYRTDTHLHVFSNASGQWASLDLTKD